jgi:hypothetical protein
MGDKYAKILAGGIQNLTPMKVLNIRDNRLSD